MLDPVKTMGPGDGGGDGVGDGDGDGVDVAGVCTVLAVPPDPLHCARVTPSVARAKIPRAEMFGRTVASRFRKASQGGRLPVST
jgi:hypothetical protein